MKEKIETELRKRTVMLYGETPTMEVMRQQAFPTFIYAYDLSWVDPLFREIEDIWEWFTKETEGLPYNFHSLSEGEKWWVLHLIALRKLAGDSEMPFALQTLDRLLRRGPGGNLERFSVEVNMVGDILNEQYLVLKPRTSFLLESGLQEEQRTAENLALLRASGTLAESLRELPKDIYSANYKRMLRPDAFEVAGYIDIHGSYADCFTEYFLSMVAQDHTWEEQPSAKWRAEYIRRLVTNYTRFSVKSGQEEEVRKRIISSLQPLLDFVNEWSPGMMPKDSGQ